MLSFRTRRERQLWGAAIVLLALIYSTLYLVRPVTEFLRERNLLRATVAAGFLLAGAWIARRTWLARPGWRELLNLTLWAAVTLALAWGFELPEERVHLLEYGLFAGLVFSALLEHRAEDPDRGPPVVTPVVVAILITTFCGWLDEGIQYYLPNRYFGWRDVALNAAAGLIVTAAMTGRRWARVHDRETRNGAAPTSTTGC